MHGHEPPDIFIAKIAGFLGSYYLLMAVMNGAVALMTWLSGRDRVFFRLPVFGFPASTSVAWLVFSLILLLMAALGYSGSVDFGALYLDPFLFPERH